VRLLSTDISTNTPRHYTNLLESYGILETIAGRGRSSTDTSHWSNSFEGEWATNVDLSRPHISFGDRWGNTFIVDQRSSSVLKVTPQGRLYTYAGDHIAGDNGDSGYATNLHLNNPNGGWMREDGTFYILDTENGKVRRVDTNGFMTTLFATAPLGDGRAFWIKSDESLAYFGSGGTPTSGAATNLHRWTPTEGVTLARNDFQELGNIVGDERTGYLYVSDRLANRVYRMDTNFNLTPIAGNGTQSGGGEGFPALQTGLILPRSVWFIPNGGFFIGEHDPGNRIWYVDPAGIIHRWMNGASTNAFRVGDGQWFYANPNVAKVSRVRCVNSDPLGNLIITESNFGYVRRIRFQRLTP
jgi:sugar lactone lactonase YvrE